MVFQTNIRGPISNDTKEKLRVIRLDWSPNILDDMLLYQVHGGSLEYSRKGIGVPVDLPVSEIVTWAKVIKSRFLVIQTNKTEGPGQNTSVTYVFDFQSHDSLKKEILPMDKLNDCLAASQNKVEGSFGKSKSNWERCTFRNEGFKYSNSYSLNDDGDFIFEFASAIKPSKPDFSLGKIDAYTCTRSNETFCVQIINQWPEKVTYNSLRFTGPNYFLHSNSIFNETTKITTIDLSLSAKRYKSVPRKVFTITINDSTVEDHRQLRFNFDDAAEIIYITGRKIAKAYRIDQVKLIVKFIDFNSSTFDSTFNETDAYRQLFNTETGQAFLRYIPFNHQCNWTSFNLTFGNKTVFHYIAWNNKTDIGNYFFSPKFSEAQKVEDFKNNQNKLEYQKLGQIIPMGTQKNIDVRDILIGSLVKLQSDKAVNSTQDIKNTYLDPYIYKIRLKKAKFLENIYMVDTEIGEKRKVYIVISTKFENAIYYGNRMSPNLLTPIPDIFTLRDFRQMNNFFPISPTEGLVQIQELIYIIKPFEQDSSRETPSKGVNGVCLNSTTISHDRLGLIYFCIFESTAYIKQLSGDSSIVQLMTDSDTRETLNSIGQIRCIKKSDRYKNHVFIFYFPRVDQTKKSMFSENDLVLAIMRIDHLSDAKLSLVSKHLMPIIQNNGQPFYPKTDLIDIEVAGTKIMHLVKTDNQTGEFRIGVTSLGKGREPEFMYHTSIPQKELSIEPNTKLLMTNLQDETDSELNQNTVLNLQSSNYQVCFKAKLKKTGENKVVVFNPEVPAFSSLSIIELPDDYRVVDFGPLFIVNKGKKTTSLGILASKGTAIEDDYSKETDLYMFMVTDMTPTIQLKQFKDTSIINSYLEHSKVKQANPQTFKLNIVSNIYSNETMAENRLKIESEKSMIDDVQKRFEITYQLWGNPFDAGITPFSNDTKIAVEIKTDWYLGNISSDKKSQYEDLHDYYFRMDPLQCSDGHIFKYRGLAESSIEDYMGIVRVLNTSRQSQLKIDATTKGDLKRFNERGHGKITLDWACDVESNLTEVKTYVVVDKCMSTIPWVRSCKHPKNLNFIASLDQRIYRIDHQKVTSYSSNFSSSAKAYVTINESVFYVERVYSSSESYVRLCRHNITANDDRYPTENCKNTSGYFEIPNLNRREPKNFNELSLSLKVFPLNKENRYIVCMMHYNKMMGIYTLVEIMDINFHKNNEKPTQYDIMTLDYLASLFVSSDNLQLAFSANVKEGNNEETQVELDISLVYYRWRDNNKLTLMNDVVSLNYTKNYKKSSRYDHRLIGNYSQSSSESEIQGFMTKVNGTLAKFAVLLYHLSDISDIMRSITESIQIITPKKMYSPSYFDNFTFTPRQEETRTELQRAFRIVVNFQQSNAFLIHISVDYLKKVQSTRDKDQVLNGYPLKMRNIRMVPIENPFIGFQPDSDSPTPELIEDYFFMANNYKDKSYFMAYTLEIAKMRQYDQNTVEVYDSNIFGLTINNRSKPLIFDQNNTNNYLRTNSLHELNFRPIAMTVAPNSDLSNYLEHRAIFIGSEEQVIALNFTSYLNIRIKTHKVASRTINITLTGKFGHNRTLTLNVKGSTTSSLWTQTFNITIILTLVGVSLVAAVCMMIVIEKDVKLTLNENSQVVSRYSLKPVSGILNNFIENVLITNQSTEKNKEEYSISSEEEDETEDVKKNLIDRKKNSEDTVNVDLLQAKMQEMKTLPECQQSEGKLKD